MQLEKSEPPPHRHSPKSGYWVEVAKFLKGNKNEWYKIGEFSSSVAGAIRRGTYVAFVPETMVDPEQRKTYMRDNWEFNSQKLADDNKRAVIRGRYIGE